MEQMYLIEIFVDKVTIFVSEEDESSANKNLIIKINFGPRVQFIIKEGQLATNEKTKDDIIECDDQGRRKWSRTIRVGKSYLFPSYVDTMLSILSKFPLQIEVWNDDETEIEIFVGVGTMVWDTQFFHMLKESADPSKLHEPLTIKQKTVLTAECCCRQVGEITFILRLSAIGDSIITEFQQLMKNPDAFVFRTNKAPSMFQCTRIEGGDPNFCMVGSLYETTTLEDPDVQNEAKQKIEICTELQSCTMTSGAPDACKHGSGKNDARKNKYPIDKIRMGDITGPCGNANCPLAHKVRTYIRSLDTYKKEAAGKVSGTKEEPSKKICGSCSCVDDRFHREGCPDKNGPDNSGGKTICGGCGGVTKTGETCQDRQKKLYGTGATPKGSKTKVVAYELGVPQPDLKQSVFGRNFIVENLNAEYNNLESNLAPSGSKPSSCCCHRLQPAPAPSLNAESSNPNACTVPHVRSTPVVFNVEVKGSKPSQSVAVYNCTDTAEDKDCKCDPPKPSPPCHTFDCECITGVEEIASRKAHKPYCPSYKHKSNCPVTLMHHHHHDEDEFTMKKKADDDDDETEPLPYGLPPIHLGPCPVLGRPCSVPDGFTRMYKTAILPPAPPSYSDAGKVCCSKEYERIKKAINEYLKKEKENDFRCINRFNVDTERRCCDKEQRLRALEGKGCCGTHKAATTTKKE